LNFEVNGHLVLSFKNKTGRQEFKDKKKVAVET
jgi:hypothetical protein